MATSKVILAVVVVAAIAFAQIEARPSTTDNNWASVFGAEFNKTLENNYDSSDIVKNATQLYDSVIETFTKNLPADVTPEKLIEVYEEVYKALESQMSELNKKVQGNTELAKKIKALTKKHYDSLNEKIREIRRGYRYR